MTYLKSCLANITNIIILSLSSLYRMQIYNDAKRPKINTLTIPFANLHLHIPFKFTRELSFQLEFLY